MRAPLNESPIRSRRRSALVAVVAVTALVFAGCGSDDGGDESTGDTGATTETTAAPTVSTEAGSTTTGGPSSEVTDPTEPADTGDTTEPPEASLSPGDPCSIEEGDPDCIDPDGDGEGVYLTGGADCIADAPDPSVCEDLDGDGVAGYPDEYEDLPMCSDEVPPPCTNEPGSHEE